MFIAGILIGIIVCVALLAGFVCEVMGTDARSVFDNFGEETHDLHTNTHACVKEGDMSWYSDGEPFDEWEGCKKCNFNKHPSARTCKGCKTGDKWNYAEWEEEGTDDE